MKNWHWGIIALLVGYVLAVYVPGPGNWLKGKLGGIGGS